MQRHRSRGNTAAGTAAGRAITAARITTNNLTKMAAGITREEKRIRIAEACGVHTKHCRGWTMTHAAYGRGESGEWKHFRSNVLSITAVSNNSRPENFLNELRNLFQKYNLCVVPTYQGEISAHDPMAVTELDSFWQDYFSAMMILRLKSQ